MPRDLPPVHRHLDFMSPLSGQRANDLVRFVAENTNGTVVDIGCGWAEILLRLLEAKTAVRGIGIDLDGAAIQHARALCAQRNLEHRIELIEGDANTYVPESVQGAISIGSTQAWASAGSDFNQPLDYTAALNKLRSIVTPGSPVVFGEAIWSKIPTEAAMAPLAGIADEFKFLADLVDLAEQSGFVVMQVHEANLDEWDHFESGFTAGYAEWLANHNSDHPDYDAMFGRMKEQRQAYLNGYRGIMGMAYLCLLAVE